MSADQIANIETGRPRDGVRTREITIDELPVIARALGTSPMRLVFAVGVDDTTEVAGAEIDTYDAARWWRGDDLFPSGTEPTASELDAHLYPVDALSLYDWHRKIVGSCEWLHERDETEQFRKKIKELAECRRQLRAGRFLLPRLPAFLVIVDAINAGMKTVKTVDTSGAVIDHDAADLLAQGTPDE